MQKVIQIKIDLKKVKKDKLFNAQSGAVYLDAVLFLKDEPDQYGNNGMIVQSVTKAEREQGIKGAILGNAKVNTPQVPQAAPQASPVIDDLPF